MKGKKVDKIKLLTFIHKLCLLSYYYQKIVEQYEIRIIKFFCLLVLLLGHGCENLLHLVEDVVQLVRVPLCNFLNGVTH